MSSGPLVCHVCWPKRENWNEPCEHAMFVYKQGQVEAHARATALAAELAVERDRFNAVKAALNLFTAGIDEALALAPPQAAP